MFNFTLTDISGALSRLFDVPPGNPALSRYAGQLETFVNNNADLKRSGLGGSGFQTIAMANLPPELSDMLNPSKVQELQRQQAAKANLTSSDYVALMRAGGAMGFAMRQMDQGSSSSADYARMPGEWTVAKLQSYAKDLGIGWAANNPELLKLGPAAIQTLAEAHIRQETYNRLVKESG